MAYRDGLGILVGYWRLCLACLAFLRNGIYESFVLVIAAEVEQVIRGYFLYRTVGWSPLRLG